MITFITRSLYERDKNEQSHSERVAELCKKTAQAMHVEGHQIEEIALLGIRYRKNRIRPLNGNIKLDEKNAGK